MHRDILAFVVLREREGEVTTVCQR